MHEVKTDGNCLFRAVAAEVFGDEEDYIFLRAHVAIAMLQATLKNVEKIPNEWFPIDYPSPLLYLKVRLQLKQVSIFLSYII